MMIDRCSNKVAITSQDRLQPIDKWEDYPIKVLDIASLIMVTLLTVSSFFSTFGCFLRDGRSSSGDLPSLSSLWMASRCEWLSPCQMAAPPGIYSWRSFGCKERGGWTNPQSGPGRPAWADRPRSIPARFGRPFAPVGPQVVMHFAPSTCTILTMSSSRPNQPPEWARLAGLSRPAQSIPARFGRPFNPVGRQVIMHFAPSTCTILTMSSSRPIWIFAWSPVFYASILRGILS
jgi:hypothetical protein